MGKELPSPELLRKLLKYDAETGKLFWNPRDESMFPDARAAKKLEYEIFWARGPYGNNGPWV